MEKTTNSSQRQALLEGLDVEIELAIPGFSLSFAELLRLEKGDSLSVEAERFAKEGFMSVSGERLAKGELKTSSEGEFYFRINEILY